MKEERKDKEREKYIFLLLLLFGSCEIMGTVLNHLERLKEGTLNIRLKESWLTFLVFFAIISTLHES